MLALIVILVCIKMGIQLFNEPSINSRIIIQDAFKNLKYLIIIFLLNFVSFNSEANKLFFDVSNSQITLETKTKKMILRFMVFQIQRELLF